jgi:hypothetical protein
VQFATAKLCALIGIIPGIHNENADVTRPGPRGISSAKTRFGRAAIRMMEVAGAKDATSIHATANQNPKTTLFK